MAYYTYEDLPNGENTEFPLPLYKCEKIANSCKAIILELCMRKGRLSSPAYITVAIDKNDLKALIKDIMKEELNDEQQTNSNSND